MLNKDLVGKDLKKLTEPPRLGESYHVSWSNKAVVGVCTKIKGEYVELSRPKTRKPFANFIHVDELRHTRKQQERIMKGLSPYPDRTNDPQFQKRLRKFKL